MMKRSPLINPDWPDALRLSKNIIPFYGKSPETRRDGSRVRYDDYAIGMSSGEVLRYSHSLDGRGFWKRAEDDTVRMVIKGIEEEMPMLAKKIEAVMRGWS